MDYRIIKAPGESVLKILEKKTRIGASGILKDKNIGAVGLVQGKVCEMLCAADIAEKAANVIVEDVNANCPQVFITLAIFGDISDVKNALIAIKEKSGDSLW